jgi:hypothetical protein
LFGVFERQVLYANRVAINAYLNRYIVDNRGQDRIRDVEIESEYYGLRGGKRDRRDAPIVTIFGYAPNDGELLHSPAFRLECALIALIGEIERQESSGVLLIYVPHPVHASADFDFQIFRENNVRVYRNSVFTWLISDLCISLSSSAMFEAEYFGVRAFTPMIAADNIFTDSYLDLVSHPKEGSLAECVRGLRYFISGYSRDPAVDVVGRARERLALMSWND